MNKNINNIVIIGGGISGLKLSCNLGNNLNKDFNKVTLIDKNNFYIWKPFFHLIASRKYSNYFLNEIDYNYISKKNNFSFINYKLINIDRKNKKIYLENNNLINKYIISLNYTILVISIGSEVNDFNINGVKKNCIKLDNLKNSKKCFEKIYNLLNIAKNYTNEKFIISIVGAGPTGVELSSEIYFFIEKYFINNKTLLNNIKIILIESTDYILPNISKKISNEIYNNLIKLNINILLNTKINKVTDYGLFTDKGFFIKSNLIIWTTGIKVNDNIKKISDLELNHLNQFVVNSNLSTTKDNSIFSIGDCCFVKYNSNIIIPPKAQSAIQMSNYMYYKIKNILNNNNKLDDFIYNDKGIIINLSNLNTFCLLKINLFKKEILIKGIFAKIIYLSLYRIYQINIHGLFRTLFLIIKENIYNLF